LLPPAEPAKCKLKTFGKHTKLNKLSALVPIRGAVMQMTVTARAAGELSKKYEKYKEQL
jgi:hypothetical protein